MASDSVPGPGARPLSTSSLVNDMSINRPERFKIMVKNRIQRLNMINRIVQKLFKAGGYDAVSYMPVKTEYLKQNKRSVVTPEEKKDITARIMKVMAQPLSPMSPRESESDSQSEAEKLLAARYQSGAQRKYSQHREVMAGLIKRNLSSGQTDTDSDNDTTLSDSDSSTNTDSDSDESSDESDENVPRPPPPRLPPPRLSYRVTTDDHAATKASATLFTPMRSPPPPPLYSRIA